MNSILDQISQIKEGLTIETMSALTANLDITEKHLAKVAGLSISTLAIRKKTGRLKQSPKRYCPLGIQLYP